jgi:GTPase SAR1 family protein
LSGKGLVCAIVGNKKDIVDNSTNTYERQVSMLEAAEMAQQHGMMFFETSAVTGENIEEVFLKLSKSIIFKMDNGTFIDNHF